MHFTLHLTRACNLRCSYCYAPPQSDRGMTFETARQVMDLGSRLNAGNSCGLVFFGGEPLLKEDLIREIVAEAKLRKKEGRGDYHYKMTTNGLLLSDSFLQFSVENEIVIAMSMDGVEAVHDRHRRLPNGGGSFAVLLPKLRRLLEVRPYASVLMVVEPDTVARLVESVCFLLDEGCRYLVVSLNYEAEWTEADMDELERQYERLGELYVEWTRQERKFYLSPFETKLGSHIQGPNACIDRCELGMKQISVDPQGFLFPCVQFVSAGPESRWCIGHASTGIDETARDRLRDESEREKESCKPCALRHRCFNTCGCLNWQTTGNVNRVSPVLCRHERMLIPIADRIGATLYAERNPLFLHKHYNAAYPLISFLEDNLERRECSR
jgi:uncharacterized protein